MELVFCSSSYLFSSLGVCVGYEIIYSYHEKQDGNYNKEETKTLKKKVGDPFEDVSLETLASSVMGQLARRDIFVIGVEIFELAKKKITFRETDNGVVIKNKKFLFDQASGNFITQEVEPEQSTAIVPLQGQNTLYPHEQLANLKKELTASGQSGKNKGYRLTVDKKYAVYGKTGSMHGEILTIIDDTNREIKISDKFFVPGNVNLLADNELNFSETQKQREHGNLYWGGAVADNVPNLRK
jgi:hypothetical protein